MLARGNFLYPLNFLSLEPKTFFLFFREGLWRVFRSEFPVLTLQFLLSHTPCSEGSVSRDSVRHSSLPPLHFLLPIFRQKPQQDNNRICSTPSLLKPCWQRTPPHQKAEFSYSAVVQNGGRLGNDTITSKMELRPVQWELTIRRFGTCPFFPQVLLFLISHRTKLCTVKFWLLTTKQEALLDLWFRLAGAGNLSAAIGRRGWGEKWRLQVSLAMAGRRKKPSHSQILGLFFLQSGVCWFPGCLTGAQ